MKELSGNRATINLLPDKIYKTKICLVIIGDKIGNSKWSIKGRIRTLEKT